MSNTTIGNTSTPTVIAAPFYAYPQVNQVNIESNIQVYGLYALDDGRYLEPGFSMNGVHGPVRSPLVINLYKNSEITGKTIGLAGLHGGLYVINQGSITGQTVAVYLQGSQSTVDNAGIIGTYDGPQVGILLDGGTIFNDAKAFIFASDIAIYGQSASHTWQYGSNTSDVRNAGPVTVFNRGIISDAVAISLADGGYIQNDDFIQGLTAVYNTHVVNQQGGLIEALAARTPGLVNALAIASTGNTTVDNNPGGTIEGSLYSTQGRLVLVNEGVVAPLTVAAGQTVSTTEAFASDSGGYVYNVFGTITGIQGAVAFSPAGTLGSRTHVAGTVFNRGILTTTGTASTVVVDLGAGGTVTNWGTILTSGTGSAGVEIGFGGTLINGASGGSAGKITASGIGVIAYGGVQLVQTVLGRNTVKYTENNAVTVTNANGSIVGQTGILFAANAFYTLTGTYRTYLPGEGNVVVPETQTVTSLAATTASLNNKGFIGGTSSSGEGVVFGGPSSTLTNSGKISGVRNAVVDIGGTLTGSNAATGTLTATGTYATALSFARGGSFNNAGLISANASGGIGVVLGQAATFTDSGSVSAGAVGIYSLETGPSATAMITVSSPVTATGSGGVGVEMVGGGTLTNSSAITVGTAGQAGVLFSAGTVTGAALSLSNTGTISGPLGVEVVPGSTGVSSFGSATLSNTGHITGGSGAAIQLDAAVATTRLTNSGTIAGSSGVNVVSGVTASLAGDAIYVSNTALISATGAGDALSFNGGEGAVSVNNTGTISAVATGIFSDGALTLTGAGAIEATGSTGTGILLGGTLATQSAAIGSSVLVSGYFDGAALLNSGVSLTNAGSIAATGTGSSGVLLNAGGTLTNSGRITGAQYGVDVNGGYGAAAPNALVTNTGTILGGAYGLYISGPGKVVAGSTTVSREGLASATLADSGLIASQPSAGGTFGLIAAHFASGNDTLLLDPGAKIGGAVVGSDTGQNTIEIGSGESAFVAGIAPAAGTLHGLGVVVAGGYTWQFANFETLSVDAGGYLGLGGTNTLGATATLASAGTVLNAGSLSLTSALSLSGEFENAGTITGSSAADGIALAGGSTFFNLGASTATTAGSVQVGVTLGASSTLFNGGTLTQTSLGQNSKATLLGGDESGTLSASSGYLRLAAGTNGYGTLDLSNTTGFTQTTEYYGTSWTLTGSGDLGAFTDRGVLTNEGTLSANHAEIDVGVQNPAYAPALLNYGTIDATVLLGTNGQLVNLPGATITRQVVGFYPNVTVFNYGAIEGHGASYAIKLRYTGTVVLGPDATFGYVFGGNRVYGAAIEGNGSSVLDLVSGPTSAGYGVISGIGSEISGFSAVGIDVNAHWQFIGNNTLGTGTVAQNYGALITSGSLGGNGALVNRNALANFGTINVGTLLNAGIFLNAGVVQSGLILSNSAYLYNRVYAGQTGTVVGNITATGTGINVINAGTLEGNVALYSSGGYLALRPGETIDGTVTVQAGNTLDLGVTTTISGGTTLSVPGTITGIGTKYAGFSAERVEAGAAWYLAGNNTLAAGTVFNNLGAVEVIGTLVNSGQFNGQLGIGPGGTATNASGGVISGEVVLANPGTGTPGVFLNAGQINAKAGQAGVVDFGGGTITNTNEIQGGAFGVYVDGGTSGDPVTVIQNGGFINSTYGVYFDPSVTSATLEVLKGNIKASGSQHLAVDFASGDDRLELSPNAQQFSNQLVVASATGHNTIELLAGAGKLSNVGSTYVNFTGLAVDTGANWSLSSANSIGTLSGAGQLSLLSRGTLAIGSAGSFSGSLTDGGLLDLGASGALGTGTITLNGSATVRLEAGVTLANTLTKFASTDTIDVRGLVGGTIALTGSVLSVGNATTTDRFTLVSGPSNAASLVAESDGAGGTQIVFQSGTLGAAVNVPTLLSFGHVHAGQTATAGLPVTNGAGPGAASLGVTLASTGAFTGGTITVAPQATGTVTAGFTAPATEGVESATDTLSLSSQSSSLPSKSVTLTGTVFSYATPTLSSTSVALGATRVGDVAQAQTISLTDGAAVDPYREALDYSVPATDGGFNLSGGGTVSAGGSGQIGITLPTTQAGTFAANLPVTLVSDGAGTSGLGTTALPSATLAASGSVYALAKASQPANIAAGLYHVGKTVGASFYVTNTATGSLVDGLMGTLTSSSPYFGGGSFTNLAAGSADKLSILYGLHSAGSFSVPVTLALSSVDPALAPYTLPSETFTVSGTANYYAQAGLQLQSGSAALTGSAGTYTLTIQATAGVAATVGFYVDNTAPGPADSLNGSFRMPGSPTGFSNAGLYSFSGVAAGQASPLQQVTVDDQLAGTIMETIFLDPVDVNPDGSLGQPTVTVNVVGIVAANPPAITSVTTLLGPVANGGTTHFEGLTVSGTAEPNSTVSLSDTDGTEAAKTVTAGQGGDWSLTYQVSDPAVPSSDYAVALQATATDAAGALEGMSGLFTFEIEQPAVVCYCRGTLILTDRGEVAVEAMAVGDTVVTASGEHRPIRWLGHNTVDCRDHPNPSAVLPVRVRPGAFGPGMPVRELWLSPGHAVCLDVLGEVLVQVGELVNGATIVQEPAELVEYWHVELDTHDLLVANGMPAESYIDVGNRDFFTGGSAGPDDIARTLDDYCRPLILDPATLAVLRARLLACAASLGWATDWVAQQPRLEADGVELLPQEQDGMARFLVPAGARDVWLTEPGFVPRQVGLNTDTRRLGLELTALRITDGLSFTREIGPNNPLLCVGFHAAEEGTGRVWTTDRALLPASLWHGCRGDFFLTVAYVPGKGRLVWRRATDTAAAPVAEPKLRLVHAA